MSKLPPVLRRIIRAIGVPATLTLLDARGGTRLYLSGKPAPHTRKLLTTLLGETAADALNEEFGPGDGVDARVDLPKRDKLIAQVRDAEIAADTEHSLTELALIYRLTTRQVQYIRARSRESSEPADEQKLAAQGDLFGAVEAAAR